MIQYLSVTKQYKGNNAVEDISFEISEGEFVFLVGPSGSGKTTLIKMLIREEVPSTGKIFFRDEDITRYKQQQVYQLRRKIGVIFQDFKLIPDLNAFENVAFAMEVAGKSDKEIKENVPYLLDIVGLSNHLNSFPRELSGGEKQRVAIARAMANNPKVLIADEPTGNLDPESAWDIVQILNKINNWGTTIIMSTHGFEIVNTLHKRVIRMEKGKILRDDLKGTYEDLDDFSIKVIANSANSSPEKTDADAIQKIMDDSQKLKNAIKSDDPILEEETEQEEPDIEETEVKEPVSKEKSESNDKPEPKHTKLKQYKNKLKFSKIKGTKKKAEENLINELESKILENIDNKILKEKDVIYIKNLDLTKKQKNILIENDISTVDDLIDIGTLDLEKIDKLSESDIKDISKIIEQYSN